MERDIQGIQEDVSYDNLPTERKDRQCRSSYLSPVILKSDIDRLITLPPGVHMRAMRASRPGSDLCGPDRTDDLYIMRYSNDSSAVKIGRGRNAESRRRQLEAGQNFHMLVLATFPKSGHLEAQVRSELEGQRCTEGAGQEWFEISSQKAIDVVNRVLTASRASASAVDRAQPY